MQNLFVKFSIIIFVFISTSLSGQGIYKALNKADSLYISKKYAEAYTEYLHIFEQGKYTPQMLLKMAYVKEGLGEVPEALYYLNVYYVNFPGQNILKKMESLAETKNLEGYEYNDLNYFLYLYFRYKTEIIMSMVGLLFLIFLGIVTNRVMFNRIPVSSPYLFLFLTAFVYIFINYSGKFFYRGIVTNEKALIMNAPSAGANLVSTLPKGTRIHIWGETDIWYKIRLNGNMAYVRKSNMTIPQSSSDNVIKNSFFSFKEAI
jgi:hypothetical protein